MGCARDALILLDALLTQLVQRAFVHAARARLVPPAAADRATEVLGRLPLPANGFGGTVGTSRPMPGPFVVLLVTWRDCQTTRCRSAAYVRNSTLALRNAAQPDLWRADRGGQGPLASVHHGV